MEVTSKKQCLVAMLNAILNSKSAYILDENGVPEAVADILRTREDARTSTIFERLSYLPGPVAWSLLRRACGGSIPNYRLVSLDRIEFWPNWLLERDDRNHAQPDVFLRWTVGDPEKIIEMIVEAKLPWNSQGERQWRDQLEAYCNHILGLAPGLEPTTESTFVDGLIYLCVDGLGRRPWEAIATRKTIADLPPNLPSFSFAACSWQTLTEALGEMALNGELLNVPPALAADLRSAFAFLGHVHFAMPDALLSMTKLADPTGSLSTLGKWEII